MVKIVNGLKLKNGRHKRCCSYKNYCVGKKCSKKNKKCKNVQRIRIVRKRTCQWRKRKTNCKERKCCSVVTEVSKGVNKVISRKCKWEGKTICKKWVHGCRWRAVGKSGRRKYCCKHLSVCNNGNCIKKKIQNVNGVDVKLIEVKLKHVNGFLIPNILEEKDVVLMQKYVNVQNVI